jgi:hypothetical protein
MLGSSEMRGSLLVVLDVNNKPHNLEESNILPPEDGPERSKHVVGSQSTKHEKLLRRRYHIFGENKV